jgi:hypothetical protein
MRLYTPRIDVSCAATRTVDATNETPPAGSSTSSLTSQLERSEKVHVTGHYDAGISSRYTYDELSLTRDRYTIQKAATAS